MCQQKVVHVDNCNMFLRTIQLLTQRENHLVQCALHIASTKQGLDDVSTPSSGSIRKSINVPQDQVQSSRKSSSQLSDAILRRKEVEKFMAFFRTPLSSHRLPTAARYSCCHPSKVKFCQPEKQRREQTRIVS